MKLLGFVLSFFLLIGCEKKEDRASILHVAVSSDYPPFVYNKNDKLDGFEIELITAIAGKLGKTIEMKQDKKGNTYLAFSAFSAEKVGEEFAFTWVRFVRFSPDREDWLQEKANIEAKGQLDLSVYNDRLNIGCRLSELAKWDKQPYCPF